MLDAEIERLDAEQATRTDGIHGRVNHVTYASEPNPDTRLRHSPSGRRRLIGRFGLKARIATLDDFTADALQGDMGITSPLRPRDPEPRRPDRRREAGRRRHDARASSQRANYIRTDSPSRRAPTPRRAAGQLFADAMCAACHVPR